MNLNIATCRGNSQGVAMTFDVFQQFNASTDKATGKAFYTYIVGAAPEDNKNLGIAAVTISPAGDRLVQLFSILESERPFATLTVPHVEGVNSKTFKARFIDTDFKCLAR